MALHSAEFPFSIPAMAVPWQNCFQMSLAMVQFGPKIAGSSSFGKYGKPAGTETRSASGTFSVERAEE
jgi:hypothetical protein